MSTAFYLSPPRPDAGVEEYAVHDVTVAETQVLFESTAANTCQVSQATASDTVEETLFYETTSANTAEVSSSDAREGEQTDTVEEVVSNDTTLSQVPNIESGGALGQVVLYVCPTQPNAGVEEYFIHDVSIAGSPTVVESCADNATQVGQVASLDTLTLYDNVSDNTVNTMAVEAVEGDLEFESPVANTVEAHNVNAREGQSVVVHDLLASNVVTTGPIQTNEGVGVLDTFSANRIRTAQNPAAEGVTGDTTEDTSANTAQTNQSPASEVSEIFESVTAQTVNAFQQAAIDSFGEEELFPLNATTNANVIVLDRVVVYEKTSRNASAKNQDTAYDILTILQELPTVQITINGQVKLYEKFNKVTYVRSPSMSKTYSTVWR